MTKLERIVNHCKASVIVTANEHRNEYESVEKYLTVPPHWSEPGENRLDVHGHADGVLGRCIETGQVWEIQAYDQTPVGSYSCIGSTLDEACDIMLQLLDLAP